MFSVVIPVYNKSEYIERAVESVSAQSCDLVTEIVIVNDGSTDNSLESIEKIQKSNHKIVLVDQPNQGVSSARNNGVDNSNNPYVIFLDADDEWLPDFVSTIRDLIQKHPACSVFSTAYKVKYFGKKAESVNFKAVPTSKEGGELENYFKSSSLGPGPVWTSVVCVSKEAFYEVGGFPVGITHGEDKILWGKLALKLKFAWSPYVGAIYHMGTVNQSSGTWHPQKGQEYLRFLTTAYEQGSNYNPDVFSAIVAQHRVIYNNCVSKKYFKSALKELVWLVKNDSAKSIPEHVGRLMVPNYLIRKLKSLKLSSNTP